jgi:hypothetical protein
MLLVTASIQENIRESYYKNVYRIFFIIENNIIVYYYKALLYILDYIIVNQYHNMFFYLFKNIIYNRSFNKRKYVTVSTITTKKDPTQNTKINQYIIKKKIIV